MSEEYSTVEEANKSKDSAGFMISIYEAIGFTTNVEVKGKVLTIYYKGEIKEIEEKLNELGSDIKDDFKYTSKTTTENFINSMNDDGYTCK